MAIICNCRELLKHLGFSDMLPAPPPATPTGDEGLGVAEDTLGKTSLQGGSPVGQQPGTPPAPIASAPSGEDFFSALGGAGVLCSNICCPGGF